MDTAKRLEQSLENADLQTSPEASSDHPLTDMGKHNLAALERLGEEQRERILGLMWAIMADKLQPLAMHKYGHTGEAAVRGVLQDIFSEVDQGSDLDDLSQQFRREVVDHGLTELQAEELWNLFVAGFPALLADFIAEGVDRWRLLPRTAAPEAIDVLVRMMKEVGDDHG